MSVAKLTNLSSSARSDLRILSLDGGGPNGLSQLKILLELTHRMHYDGKPDDAIDELLRPCGCYDLIGGSGTGGFIAILLVVFGMSLDDALDAFYTLNEKLYDGIPCTPDERTTRLEIFVQKLLQDHGLEEDAKLTDPNGPSRGCKLVIPIVYSDNAMRHKVFRNYAIRDEPNFDVTIREAILATCAFPGLFKPVDIARQGAVYSFFGGDLGISNPTREIIKESYRTFGGDYLVACVTSIGSGHLGVIHAPTLEGSSPEAWLSVMQQMITTSESISNDVEERMGHLGLYFRFSVDQGLQFTNDVLQKRSKGRYGAGFGEIMTHTNHYLASPAVSRVVNACVTAMVSREGVATLEQLYLSGGGATLVPGLPPLTSHFVNRKVPWQLMKTHVFGDKEETDVNRQTIVVVSGMTGSGKTQLVLSFAREFNGQFSKILFLDGSTRHRLRSDMLHQVRSIGPQHTNKALEDCILLLAQPSRKTPRNPAPASADHSGIQQSWLIIMDNVDDGLLDLRPFIPQCDHGCIIITTRDPLRGQMSPQKHLELDVMNAEEAVETLLRAAGRYSPTIKSMEGKGELSSGPKLSEVERNAVDGILEAVGCLPAAIVQVGSHIYNTHVTFQAYLSQLLSHRKTLLSKPAISQRDKRHTTAFAAFDTTYKILPPRIQQFLRILSLCHCRRLPISMLKYAAKENFEKQYVEYLPRQGSFNESVRLLKETFFPDGSGSWDETTIDSMIVTLRQYSLINTTQECQVLDHQPLPERAVIEMHPLTHLWAQEFAIEGEKERSICEMAVLRLLACGACMEDAWVAECIGVHVRSIKRPFKRIHPNDLAAFALAFKKAGRWESALKYRKKAKEQMEIHIVRRGEQAKRKQLMLDPLEDLALAHFDYEQYDEAKEIQEAVVEARFNRLGRWDPVSLQSYADLLNTYLKIGGDLLQVAIKGLEKLYSLRKREFTADHHLTLTTMSNLAVAYVSVKKYTEAKTLQTQVYNTRKKVLGEEDPATLDAAENLAITLWHLGEHVEAHQLRRYVLETRTKLLGPTNPETMTAAGNLASSSYSLGRYQEARYYEESLLKDRRSMFGPEHKSTIETMINLAETLQKLGKSEEALALASDGKRLIEEVMGGTHVEVKRAQWVIDAVLEVKASPGIDIGHSRKGSVTTKSLRTGLWI